MRAEEGESVGEGQAVSVDDLFCETGEGCDVRHHGDVLLDEHVEDWSSPLVDWNLREMGRKGGGVRFLCA